MNKAIVIHKETSGTASPTVILTTQTVRKLTTVVQNDNDIGTGNPIIVGGTITSNTITISPGTYRFNFITCVSGASGASTVNSFISYFYNVTTSAFLYATNPSSNPVVLKTDAANAGPNLICQYRGANLVIAGNTVIELCSVAKNTASTVIGGQAAGLSGLIETYTIIEIESVV